MRPWAGGRVCVGLVHLLTLSGVRCHLTRAGVSVAVAQLACYAPLCLCARPLTCVQGEQ